MEYKDRPRSHDQNAKMWAMLNDISEQLEWCVNGCMQKMSSNDWKHVLTAGLHKEQRVAAGIDGGFVILGQSTRKMTVRQMVELIEFMEWFGSERKVKFRAPEVYEEYLAYAG